MKLYFLVAQASVPVWPIKGQKTIRIEAELEHRLERRSEDEFSARFRNLPHFEQAGCTYFITFRTFDLLTLSDPAKDIVLSTIRYHNGKKYRLCACVIMDDHVHLILQPLPKTNIDCHSLAEIMHSIKSYSANRMQRILGLKGSVWLDENYDRIIRDDKDLLEKLNYISENPVKTGLVKSPETYPWLFFDITE